MIDPLWFYDLADLFAPTFSLVSLSVRRVIGLVQLYGPSGIVLFIFGSFSIWNLEAKVLSQLDEESVDNFKKSILDECTMISVSAAIVAQIAITGFSLNFLSQTHWIARALLLFSLTAALMAVYYASTQQRILGRLHKPVHVRKWIRGPVYGKFRSDTGQTFDYRRFACDPDECDPQPLLADRELRGSVLSCCFRPGIASVLTISAPQALLSVSLISLLVALGIYLGFIWTRDLDTNASGSDSRNVFIFYIIGLWLCFFIYSLSSIAQYEEDDLVESRIIRQAVDGWVRRNPELLQRWGYHCRDIGNGEVLIEPIGHAMNRQDPL